MGERNVYGVTLVKTVGYYGGPAEKDATWHIVFGEPLDRVEALGSAYRMFMRDRPLEPPFAWEPDPVVFARDDRGRTVDTAGTDA